jgi:hypothetical protein
VLSLWFPARSVRLYTMTATQKHQEELFETLSSTGARHLLSCAPPSVTSSVVGLSGSALGKARSCTAPSLVPARVSTEWEARGRRVPIRTERRDYRGRQ